MKAARFMALFSIFASLNSLALPKESLKTGDIILLDMDCFSCELIEQQTGGPFSHSGIVLKHGSRYFVAQSLGNVHHIPLKNFLSYSRKKAQVMRPKYLSYAMRKQLLANYQEKYMGQPFDHDYIWDDEKLYCSEFLYKLLKSVYAIVDFVPKPMSYDKNTDAWERYFGKKPPTGLPGLSPNDFYYSSDFEDMGLLY